MQRKILLISFYNQSSLGTRYLEVACRKADIEVELVFFKKITFDNPLPASPEELQSLKAHIQSTQPALIGLSVMSSLHIQTVIEVNQFIKANFNIPTIWGSTYATVFPKESLDYADFVIRGEGEDTLPEFCEAYFNGTSYEHILNLGYKKDSERIINEVRPLRQDLDNLGYPILSNQHKLLIEGCTTEAADNRLTDPYYEIAASRGCPYGCTYCMAISFKRVYSGKGRYLRFRSVKSVLEELNNAKVNNPYLKEIRFWDEVFSDEPEWVDEFVRRYKAEIALPFEIWTHPLNVSMELISKLMTAGLYSVVMGIQSGSQRLRKEVFHRGESNEAVIEASRIFAECAVPNVVYDFMLQHPFETDEDIKASYEICKQLHGNYIIQTHGLMFFPGADISEMAVKQGYFSAEELRELMLSPYSEQWKMFHKYETHNPISNFWYNMINLEQRHYIRPFLKVLEKHPNSRLCQAIAQKAVVAAPKISVTARKIKKKLLRR
ncbi:MAG: B12-binding domain-containing radical SAM protein [Oscillospiraceae bacterium]|jgi:radical SAM superfamily enzyme YgiQ (UPF0313 family)|nr:B12-binding domain-containing radical SAM protein [Oscillospiraceae bacterium]